MSEKAPEGIAAEEFANQCLRDAFRRGLSSITTQAAVVNMIRAFNRGIAWERERAKAKNEADRNRVRRDQNYNWDGVAWTKRPGTYGEK